MSFVKYLPQPSFASPTWRLSFLVGTLIAAPAVAQWSPPSKIDPAAFGAATFTDEFDVLDAGPDRTEKTAVHCWRTITKECIGWKAESSGTHDCRTAGREGVYADATIGVDPFRVKGGKAYIDIKPLPAALAERWGRGFSTGWLSTKFTFAQRYGYFEARLALPAGKGMWPAFWLMPVTGQWPANGEIDVMEGLGVEGVIYASIHAKPTPSPTAALVPAIAKALHSTHTIKAPATLTRTYHLYSVAWTAREIVWYLDRREIRRIATPSDVHQPMFPILNVATGGSWPGPMKVKSGRMAIDYVRVWQVPY